MRSQLFFWIIPVIFLGCIPQASAAEYSPDSVLFSEHGSRVDSSGSPTPIVINQVFIRGNRKTKRKVILRELTFDPGDVILPDNLMQELETSKLNIYNTGLFKNVKLNIKRWEEENVDIDIVVTERWYYIPMPIFQLIDRNFNVWWTDYNHDFRRTIYGLFYSQDNVTGNNDLMRIGFYTGFSQALALMYSFPSLNKKQTLGIESFLRMNREREFFYKTEGNKHVYYRDNDYNRKSLHIGSVLRYRKMIANEHFFGLFYHHTAIEDSVFELNENYFLESGEKQNYLQMNYRYESDHRNIRAYATEGYHWSLEFEKMGLGIFNDVNHFNVYGSYSQFLDLGKNFYFSGVLKTKISAPQRQPFYNQEGLGNDQNFVRGYEFYVIDGQQYGYMRLNVKHNFLNFRLPGPQFMAKDGQYNYVPFSWYLKTFLDLGYVKDELFTEGNPLNNELLVGAGIGLDILAFYDFIFRLEYTINRTNGLDDKKVQNGLYLHFALDIDDDMRILKRARYLNPPRN